MGYSINKDGSVSRNSSSSILEKYPEYNFLITSTLQKKQLQYGIGYKLTALWCVSLIIVALSIFLTNLFDLLSTYDDFWKERYSTFMSYIQEIYAYEYTWGVIILSIIVLLIFIFFLSVYKITNLPKVTEIADYIQNVNSRNAFFVKNGKFGIVNMFNGEIVIKACFDQLKWFDDKKSFILSNRDNKLGLLAKHGKELIEPQYDTIKWYEEGNGVLRVEQNGQMFLIDIYNHRLK